MVCVYKAYLSIALNILIFIQIVQELFFFKSRGQNPTGIYAQHVCVCPFICSSIHRLPKCQALSYHWAGKISQNGKWMTT